MKLNIRLIIVLLFLVILLFFGLIYSILNKRQPTPSNEDFDSGTVATNKNVTIPPVNIPAGVAVQPRAYLLDKNANPPEQADIYSVPEEPFSLSISGARSLAQKWGFTNEPQVSQTINGNQYVFVDEVEGTMVVKDNPLTLAFAHPAGPENSSMPLTVSKEQAVTKAEEFFRRLGLLFPQNFSVKPNLTYFAKSAGSYSQTVTNASDANAIGINLGIYFNGKQIFSDSSSNSLINILIDGDGNVSFAQVILPFNLGLSNPNLVNAGSVNLKDKGTLQNDIKDGKAVIRYLKKTSGSSDEDLGNDISFLTLSSFEVSYLAATGKSGSFLYPIYVFKAAGALGSGETVEGVVYLSAVRQ